jgi:hypothetical protein
MRCYFDGSKGKDDTGGEWLTLAGYIASDGFWGDFERKWEAMLRARYPIAPWIHMYELLAGEYPFERVAGWTEDKIRALIYDAQQLLDGLDKKRYRSFVYSIDTNARKRLIAEGYTVPEPQIVCTQSCIKGAFDWYFQKHPKEVEAAYIFFDRGEPFMHELSQEWRRKEKVRKLVSNEPFWGLIRNIQSVNMRDTPPIQAADMIAWAGSRSLTRVNRLTVTLLSTCASSFRNQAGNLGRRK